jgi:hypothetical protein
MGMSSALAAAAPCLFPAPAPSLLPHGSLVTQGLGTTQLLVRGLGSRQLGRAWPAPEPPGLPSVPGDSRMGGGLCIDWRVYAEDDMALPVGRSTPLCGCVPLGAPWGLPACWPLVLVGMTPGQAYCILRQGVPLFEQTLIVSGTLGVKAQQGATSTLLPEKVVSTAPVTGVGQILDDGATSGTCDVRFDFTGSETASLLPYLGGAGVWYYLTLATPTGSYTLEIGTIPLLSGGALG